MYYPPKRSGLRGNHNGSFDVSHGLARKGQTDWGPVQSASNRVYDLVVVGGGISGLSAAYFYRKKYPKSTILILDNHDDFGGHAKRNEFDIGGQTLIGYGGAQTMQEPSDYSPIVKQLLGELGVNLKVFDTAYDQDFFKKNKLRAAIHFNSEYWGERKTVSYDLGIFDDYIPVLSSKLSDKQAVDQMPISAAAKKTIFAVIDD